MSEYIASFLMRSNPELVHALVDAMMKTHSFREMSIKEKRGEPLLRLLSELQLEFYITVGNYLVSEEGMHLEHDDTC